MSQKLPFTGIVQGAMRTKNMGLRALCRGLRLDASFFSKVLAGKRSPPSDETILRRLADLLGLAPSEVIVSTGRIPSDWLPLFEDPVVLDMLQKMSEGAPAPPIPGFPSPGTHAAKGSVARDPALSARLQAPAAGPSGRTTPLGGERVRRAAAQPHITPGRGREFTDDLL